MYRRAYRKSLCVVRKGKRDNKTTKKKKKKKNKNYYYVYNIITTKYYIRLQFCRESNFTELRIFKRTHTYGWLPRRLPKRE